MILTEPTYKEQITCHRCGLCCYLVDPITNVPTKRKCKYLISVGNNRYACRIYKTRLGKDIGMKNKCVPREQSTLQYDGCPYNTK